MSRADRRRRRQQWRETHWPGVYTPPWIYWTLAVFMGANGGWMIGSGEWAQAVSTILIAALFVLQPLLLRRSYRTGWLIGRARMLLSMEEAARRGLTGEEWAIAEAERDGVTVRRIRKGPTDG